MERWLLFSYAVHVYAVSFVFGYWIKLKLRVRWRVSLWALHKPLALTLCRVKDIWIKILIVWPSGESTVYISRPVSMFNCCCQLLFNDSSLSLDCILHLASCAMKVFDVNQYSYRQSLTTSNQTKFGSNKHCGKENGVNRYI